jgi:uroporphyrin-III C-methyltransferase
MLDGGYPMGTPACAIENGTLPAQREVLTTLAALPQAVASTGLGSPAILVIGEVARLARASEMAPALRAAGGRS